MTYNAFQKKDLHVEWKVNGELEVYSVDGNGQKNTIVDESFWQETYVCNVLRALRETPQKSIRPLRWCFFFSPSSWG